MRLRRPCEHGFYDPHVGWERPNHSCPGGEFLPEDAIVIEKENGQWPGWLHDAMLKAVGLDAPHALDALTADQVGEPG